MGDALYPVDPTVFRLALAEIGIEPSWPHARTFFSLVSWVSPIYLQDPDRWQNYQAQHKTLALFVVRYHKIRVEREGALV